MYSYSVDEITQAPEICETRLRDILRNSYGLEGGTLTTLTGYEDCNFRLDGTTIAKDRKTKSVIIKITNPIEAKRKEHMDLQVTICDALRRNDIPTPALVSRLNGAGWAVEEVKNGVFLPVRVFDVLPGTNLECHAFSENLVQQVGTTLARLHTVCDQVNSTTTHLPFITPDNFSCFRREIELLLEKGLLTMERKELVSGILEDYEQIVYNQKHLYDTGLIHSDFNETNLLVATTGDISKISGVLDFGDVHVSTRALDIAAAIVYLHLSDRSAQGLSSLMRNVLAGYRSVRRFVDECVLVTCMRARLACSLVYGLRTARINYRGGSADYVLKTQQNGWTALQELMSME